MRSFIFIWLWIESGIGLNSWIKCFLKDVLEELRVVKSKLFHSVMIQGKEDDLNANYINRTLIVINVWILESFLNNFWS